MKTTERTTPLADLIIREKFGSYLRSTSEVQLKQKVCNAHRFIFDTKASERVAEVGLSVPSLLIEHQKFARAPYDLCFIEIETGGLRQGAARLGHSTLGTPTEDDGSLGFLIDRGAVCVFACDKARTNCIVLPWTYELHVQPEAHDLLLFAKVFAIPHVQQIDVFMWGSAHNVLDKEQRRALREQHSLKILPGLRHDKCQFRTDISFLAAGELRNLISALLILNRPSATTIVCDIQPHRSFLRGKLHNFLSNSVVTVHVDAPSLVRTIREPGESNRHPPRRHEVRGHWCQNQLARDYEKVAGCVHDWVSEQPESTGDRWICSACGGKRWWRHEHSRGSAEIGFAGKEYVVTQ